MSKDRIIREPTPTLPEPEPPVPVYSPPPSPRDFTYPGPVPLPQPEPNPVMGNCPKCGLELRQMMLYCCPRNDCPCFMKVTCG